MQNIEKTIQECKQRQQAVINVNSFKGLCDEFALNDDQYVLLPQEITGVVGKLISEINRKDCQVFLWEISKDQEYLIDRHTHSYSNEFICVLEGEIVRLDDNEVLGPYQVDFIPSGQSHSYLFKSGTKLLVAFVPSVKLVDHNGRDR